MSFDPQSYKLSTEKANARGHLEWAENEMKKAAVTVMKVLKEIHEKKSWRFDYESFEEYCLKKLHLTRQRAYQIIRAQSFKEIMAGEAGPSDGAMIDGLGEGPLRELQKLEPQEAVAVVKNLSSTGRVTPGRIKSAVDPMARQKKLEAQIHEALTAYLSKWGISKGKESAASKWIASYILQGKK